MVVEDALEEGVRLRAGVARGVVEAEDLPLRRPL